MKRSNQVLWMGMAVFTLGVIGTILYMSHFSRGAGDTHLMFPSWSHRVDKHSEQTQLTGNGKLIEQAYQVQQFDKITTSGFINLHVTLGEQYQVKITTDDNLHKHLQVVVEQGELHIAPEKDVNLAPKKAIDVHVTLPQLHELHLGGDTVLKMANIKTDKLILVMGGENTANISGEINQCTLTLGGNSNVVMNLKNSQSLQVINGGEGTLSISGDANDFILNNGGQIKVNANNFKVKSAKITGAGVTNISLRAKDQIQFYTVGESTLHYFGNPKITNSSMGDVNVIKEGE